MNSKGNELSPVVQSPFGMHLIQVLERRQRDMSEERKRLDARQALRERKLDDAYQDWLRQLRDRTYVENRLEESGVLCRSSRSPAASLPGSGGTLPSARRAYHAARLVVPPITACLPTGRRRWA